MSLILIARNIGPDLAREDGTADYDVEVSINRKSYIWAGQINGHIREQGAAVLLRKIADAIDQHSAEYRLREHILSAELAAAGQSIKQSLETLSKPKKA